MKTAWVIEYKYGSGWHPVDTFYAYASAKIHYKDYCNYVGAENVRLIKYVPEKRKGKK